MNIIRGIDGFGRRHAGLMDGRFSDRFVHDGGFCGGEPQRRVADTDGADMDVCRTAVFACIIKECDPGKRKVATPACEFLESPAAVVSPRWKPHFGDQLIWFQRRGKRAGKQLGRRNCSLTTRSRNDDLRLAGDCDARHFCRRVGMREASADRAAIRI